MAERYRELLLRYGLAIGAVLLAFLARLLLNSVLEHRAVYLTFFLAVLIVGRFAGLGPGLLATGFSALAAVYLLVRNADSGTLADQSLSYPDTVALLLFLVVSLISVALSHSMHAALRRAKDSAEQMRLEREQFRVTLASIGDGVIVTNPLGEITFLNTVAEQMTGWTSAEVLGQPLEKCFRILTPDTREPTRTPVTRVVRDGRTGSIASPRILVDKAGRERAVDDSTAPIRDHEGRVVGLVLVFRDVEAQRQAQQALQQSQERLRMALEAGRMGTWEWHIPSGRTHWSSSLETLHGIPEHSFAGTYEAFQRDIHPEDREFVMQSIHETLTLGHDHRIEYRIIWPDNTIHWLETRGKLFRDEEGRPFRMMGVCMDATERKRSEATLHFLADASASLADLVDYKSTLQKVARLAVPDFADWAAVDLLSPEGELERLAVSHVKPEMVELALTLERQYPPDPQIPYGAPRVVKTGKSEMVQEITHAQLAKAARSDEHLRVLEQLGLRSYISVPLAAYGRVMGAITFVSAESGRQYTKQDLRVAEDLAHRAGVAIENARLYQELREADRRKDEFLAMLAHELRNPLAPIRTGLDLLAFDPHVPQDTVDLMQAQVEHLVRLVDDLLDVSRIMRGKIQLRKRPVELGDIIRRAADTVRTQIADRQQHLTLDLPSAEVWIHADPIRMSQVFGNLLNNASKYTNDGGRIDVQVTVADGQTVVRVCDDGIGIDRSVLPRVFDLFTQAATSIDRAQGGLGIGLTLVRSLVELHDGQVTVTSDGLGQGSEFTVMLPTADHAPAERSVPEAVVSARPVRVLVVDDNASAAKMLKLLINRLGPHEVEIAHDGASTLETASRFRPDLILLDIGLPGMDGYEVARRVRREPALNSVVLVAVTGYGQDEDRRRSREAGFHRHLVKPVALDTLKRLLATV